LKLKREIEVIPCFKAQITPEYCNNKLKYKILIVFISNPDKFYKESLDQLFLFVEKSALMNLSPEKKK